MKIDEIRGLYEFDIRSGKIIKIDIFSLIDEDIKKRIENTGKDFGLKLEIKDIDSPERFIKNYYKNNGYEVSKVGYMNCNYRDSNLIDFLDKNYPIQDKCIFESWYSALGTKGCPDFACIKYEQGKIKEILFVEAKSPCDSVKFEQFVWAFSCKAPFKFVFLLKEGI
jgi:hypothetical protein